MFFAVLSHSSSNRLPARVPLSKDHLASYLRRKLFFIVDDYDIIILCIALIMQPYADTWSNHMCTRVRTFLSRIDRDVAHRLMFPFRLCSKDDLRRM